MYLKMVFKDEKFSNSVLKFFEILSSSESNGDVNETTISLYLKMVLVCS